MASFTAASTAYATWGQPMIPFYIFYSMFGFQRVGDHDLVVRRPARAGLPARRDRGPHDAVRRGPAALRRAVADVRDGVPELPRVRPRVRVRGRRARARRHPAHVRTRARGLLLLPHALQRELRAAADARRRRGRHRARHVPATAPAAERAHAPRADPRERADGAAGARGAADARRALRRRAPTCGACPAGSSSATTRSNASAGTGCTRPSRRARRTSPSSSRHRRARSSRSPTGCKSVPDCDRPVRAPAVRRARAPTATASPTSAPRCGATSRSTPPTCVVGVLDGPRPDRRRQGRDRRRGDRALRDRRRRARIPALPELPGRRPRDGARRG